MSDRQDDSPGEYQPPDGEVFDALQESYKNALSRLERLPELDMQVAVLDETLRSHSPKEAAWWLDQLMRGSLWGQSPVIDAMLAASRWLIQKRLDDDYDLFKTIFQAAYDDGRKPVLSIMRDPPPHRELPEGKRLPEPDLPTESDAPAGKRRELARGNNRLIVERLLLDPNALVIEQLLDNPN
ncbi:MAG: hypothetical protein ACOCV2_14520, partial [Persicimonas sp.]